MINDRNHLFPLPLLWARGTTLPLEAIGGRGGTRDESGVEAPTAQAELEGHVDEGLECNFSIKLTENIGISQKMSQDLEEYKILIFFSIFLNLKLQQHQIDILLHKYENTTNR